MKIIRRIAHVCIYAKDLEETEDWYTRVLGFKKVFNFTRDGRVFGFYLDAGDDAHIEVFENSAAEASDRHPINHICFETFNLDDSIAHIRDQGVAATDKSFGCDDTWQSWISDPNGVRIELFEYASRSAQFNGGDRVANW